MKGTQYREKGGEGKKSSGDLNTEGKRSQNNVGYHRSIGLTPRHVEVAIKVETQCPPSAIRERDQNCLGKVLRQGCSGYGNHRRVDKVRTLGIIQYLLQPQVARMRNTLLCRAFRRCEEERREGSEGTRPREWAGGVRGGF